LDEEILVDLSIVVVTWNGKKFVDENFGSILADLRRLSAEVIAVDNASTDGTAEMIAERYPEVELIRSPTNLGFARGNNLAIRKSRGKYVCLVNPDVRILPGCFRKLVDYMEQNPKVGVVGPKTYNADGSRQKSCMRPPSVWNAWCRALALDRTPLKRLPLFGGLLMADFDHQTLREVDVLNGAFLMVRRAAMDEVGLIDERFFMYGDDLDWCVRFGKAGWPLVFYPGAEIVHYGGGSSSRAPVYFYVEMHRANLQYFQKHHSWLAQRGFLAGLLLHDTIRYIGFSALSLLGRRWREKVGLKAQRSMACIQWVLRSKEQSLDASPPRTSGVAPTS
jgi:GT2 family glycosyltransferase